MRRFISSMLALLVLLLSCLPCNDAIAAPSNGITAQTIQPQENQDHCNDLDSCSPFCACSCCSGFIMPGDQSIKQSGTACFFDKPFPAGFYTALPDVFLPIWQPPQLV